MIGYRVHIALLADLSGDLCLTGRGMMASFLSVVERRKQDLFEVGLNVQVTIDDYGGDPLQALAMAQERQGEGAVAIVGPCDSLAVYSLLKGAATIECAVVSPLATATALSSLGASNFFRMTSPDRSRADILVRSVTELFPGRTVFVWAYRDSQWSYSERLKADLIGTLERRGIAWQLDDFSLEEYPSRRPSAKEPLICCGPSIKIVHMIKKLRHAGLRSQIFTFGSNRNLLTPSMRNCITVADVDPEDTNLAIRQEMERVLAGKPAGLSVSVSSLNCAAVLSNLLCRRADQIRMAPVSKVRELIISDLRSSPQDGLLGRFAFSVEGEMIGPEQLAVLQVDRTLGVMRFKHLRLKRKRMAFPRITWSRLILWLLGFLSGIVALIQLVRWIL